MPDSKLPADSAQGAPPELAELAAKAVSALTSNDFASYRRAARTVSMLRFGIYRKMVDSYDPQDASDFAGLVAEFSTLFNDKREAASVFGISVSTFYRWKGGDTIPHALMRSTIRDTIRRYLAGQSFESFDCPLAGFDPGEGSEKSPTTH